MISVIIPTLDSAAALPATLECLIPAAVDGFVREVLIVDGGSSDATLKLADGYGASVVAAGNAMASRLAAGTQQARFGWLLFLEPGCILDPGWEREAAQLMTRVDSANGPTRAGVFRFTLDETSWGARAAETLMRWSAGLFGFLHPSQGLLTPRAVMSETGGFRAVTGLEFADFGRRLGRRRITEFRTAAVNSAAPYHEHGYPTAAAGYAGRLVLYALGGAPRALSLAGTPSPHQAPTV